MCISHTLLKTYKYSQTLHLVWNETKKLTYFLQIFVLFRWNYLLKYVENNIHDLGNEDMESNDDSTILSPCISKYSLNIAKNRSDKYFERAIGLYNDGKKPCCIDRTKKRSFLFLFVDGSNVSISYLTSN